MSQKTSYTLEEIAALTESKLIGNPTHQITGVADLTTALSHEVSFFSNPKYEKLLKKTKAGAIFLPKKPDEQTSLATNFLLHKNPSQAFQKFLTMLHNHASKLSYFEGIHPNATVDPSCQIGNNVTICPSAVIEKGCTIGDHSFIGAGCYIGPNSHIGKNCLIHPRVVIRERTEIHNNVIIQPGAVIGSCGFGYATNAQGKQDKLDQYGNVVIEDDVEIGANTTIDRARFQTTRIKRGTKIDNLVQIGHGVTIGEDNVIISQTGISGSTETGKNVWFGGQAATLGHLKICDNAQFSGRCAVSKDINEPGKYGGYPPESIQTFHRNTLHMNKISTYAKEIKTLKKQLSQLTELLEK